MTLCVALVLYGSLLFVGVVFLGAFFVVAHGCVICVVWCVVWLVVGCYSCDCRCALCSCDWYCLFVVV